MRKTLGAPLFTLAGLSTLRPVRESERACTYTGELNHWSVPMGRHMPVPAMAGQVARGAD